jgi:pimeloyl-ACP methyl ester carboxylesterase
MKIHDVIYIPGLGDANPRAQRGLVATWRLWGVRPQLFHINWGNGEAFTPKLERLLALIDENLAQGHTVSLVASSAGAGAAINAFAGRKGRLNGVVCIAGKINSPETIGPRYSTGNPAFVGSARQVQFSLDKLDFDTDRSRILSRYAMFDPVVPRRDSQVAGGRNRTVLSFGHSITIATQLLFGAPSFLRFLKAHR